jgi:hypothetical protein
MSIATGHFISSTRIALPLVLSTLLFPCCDLFSPTSSNDPAERVIMVDDWQTITLWNDEAVIHNAQVANGVLYLTVRYGGGCAEHTFSLYAARYFLESQPPQAVLRLSHNANNDQCKALIQTVLRFDLLPLRQAALRAFGAAGTLLLRIYPPGKNEPYTPLVVYTY